MLSTSSMERCSFICSFKYSARSALRSQLYSFFSDVVRKSLCLGLGLFGGPINRASESEEWGEDALRGDLLWRLLLFLWRCNFWFSFLSCLRCFLTVRFSSEFCWESVSDEEEEKGEWWRFFGDFPFEGGDVHLVRFLIFLSCWYPPGPATRISKWGGQIKTFSRSIYNLWKNQKC